MTTASKFFAVSAAMAASLLTGVSANAQLTSGQQPAPAVSVQTAVTAMAGPHQTDPAAPAPINPDKEKLIRQVLSATGYDKLVLQVIDQMITGMKTQYAQLPDDFWTKFRAKVKPEDLIKLVVPIYDKYYTTDDLKGLLAFYKSPLGQKVISTTPSVTQESMKAGMAWGAQLGAEAAKEAGVGN